MHPVAELLRSDKGLASNRQKPLFSLLCIGENRRKAWTHCPQKDFSSEIPEKVTFWFPSYNILPKNFHHFFIAASLPSSTSPFVPKIASETSSLSPRTLSFTFFQNNLFSSQIFDAFPPLPPSLPSYLPFVPLPFSSSYTPLLASGTFSSCSHYMPIICPFFFSILSLPEWLFHFFPPFSDLSSPYTICHF